MSGTTVTSSEFICMHCSARIVVPHLVKDGDPQPSFPFYVEHVTPTDHRLTKAYTPRLVPPDPPLPDEVRAWLMSPNGRFAMRKYLWLISGNEDDGDRLIRSLLDG